MKVVPSRTLAEVWREGGSLSEEEWLKLHAEPVLLERRVSGAEGELPPALSAAGGRSRFSTRRIDGRSYGRPSSGNLEIVPEARVVFLTKRGGSGFEKMISVGRAPNMDIVIADDSVSKFHAFFSIEGSAILLEDVGSTNGTFSEAKPLDPHQPVPLSPGDRIVFGRGPAFSFFPARDFFAAVVAGQAAS
ncbi:MAG: FHA domain-containing protein [Planctomycetales bacterium]|nr:FHA domain-containing protein [Planctomycetales bacterium]